MIKEYSNREVIDYSANRWRESWNSIPQYGGGGSIYDHGSFGGGSFTLGQILEQSDPFKYRGWYFDRENGEWVYFDELTRQYYYNKSSPYWGTGFVQVKADMGEYVRWVRDFGVQSTRIYLDASNSGDDFSQVIVEDISYWDFIRSTDLPEPIIGMPPALGKGAPLKAVKALKGAKVSDIIRTGKTVVSNQLVKGPGSTGASVTWGIKGGGPKMGFHYHIHKYNWYKPWIWFKNTPIIKPPK